MEETNKSPFSGNVDKPEKDAVRLFSGVVILAVLAIIVGLMTKDGRNFLLGLINPINPVLVDINLTTNDSEEVEPGLYGAGVAKLYDEMATEPNWLNTIKTISSELELNNLRYPAGGVVKYSHVFTENMTQTLTPEETLKIVDVGFGPELRGIGQIIKDRTDEEAIGNDGELSEIADPKSKYGGLSYLDGFQNLMPRNFIHDFVEIANSGDSGVLYVINMRYANPLEIKDQVEYLIESGIEINGYEFDNEVYAKGGFYFEPGTPSIKAPIAVTEYLNDADSFKEAILEVDPGAEFAVVAAPKKSFEEGGVGVLDNDSDWNAEWNKALALQMESHGYSDYVVHFYHPFTDCQDEVALNNKDSIFSCAKEQLRYFNNEVSGETGTTSIPPMLKAFKDQFVGKNMWLTEWNINQDPTRTDGKLSNSIIHAIFTEQFLNILNDSNAKNGNFIKYASYHTIATDGGNAMLNKRVYKNATNNEPDDINGFVRRTPYYAFLSMKEIFKDDYKPLTTSFSVSDESINIEDITLYAYKNSSGEIALSVSNTSERTLLINSLTIDGETVDLTNSQTQTYLLDGESNSSSLGSTEFETNPSSLVIIRNETFSSVSNTFLPAFGLGTIKIDPVFEEVTEPENSEIDTDNEENCGPIKNFFGGCNQNEEKIDTTPPKVSFSTPQNGQIVSGQGVQVQIQSTDKNGVERVDLYQGKTLIGTDASAPYKYVWDTSELSNGPYTLRAVSYDLAGNSASVQIKVAKSN